MHTFLCVSPLCVTPNCDNKSINAKQTRPVDGKKIDLSCPKRFGQNESIKEGFVCFYSIVSLRSVIDQTRG